MLGMLLMRHGSTRISLLWNINQLSAQRYVGVLSLTSMEISTNGWGIKVRIGDKITKLRFSQIQICHQHVCVATKEVTPPPTRSLVSVRGRIA